ncbi:MAG: PBP1A family penicillin-binding protein [Fibromonadaceae bacterium]|jgi:penicillin-binding protein 1A|nr:PBP1A family penicillin-binding protein [Fibromonadaceae bacterium]
MQEEHDEYKELNEKPDEEQNLGKKKLLWILIFGIPVILGLVAVKIIWGSLSPTLPSFEKLETIEPRLITKIYDKDSALVHEFYVEKRIWTPIDSIPVMMRNAVIATEDRKFWNHWGMNVLAIPSAVIESFKTGNRMRGASSLTQQLAKLLFLTPERSETRKIREAMTAKKKKKTYTKEEILEFYMNEVYLGGGNYGFQSAGQFYFGRPLDSLTVPEMAVLAGMLQRPEAYRPDRRPELATSRRNTVLFAMMDAGYISREEYEVYTKAPLKTEEQKTTTIAPYYMEEIRKYLEKKYGESSLYSDGISVYSTIDQKAQEIVEKAALEHLVKVDRRLRLRAIHRLGLSRRYNMPVDTVLKYFDSVYTDFSANYLAKDTAARKTFPDSVRYNQAQVGVILIENETGAVRAMVGGKDFNESKWNRAVQTLRQPGSSFKPFVYATAMDNGASPCDSVNDAPITIPDPQDTSKFWRPGNYSKEFKGMMSYRRALALSQNLPAIQVGMKYGLKNVVEYSRKFGVRRAPLQAVPSLALGSVGATLMEMTSAYTVFPNGGNRIEPYYIESIVGKNGEAIERHYKIEHEVLKRPAAYLMVTMLQAVNTGGTAARIWASGFHHPSGGKTGTTNDYTDAWYIGFTRQYTMGVWIGTDAFLPMGHGHTGTEAALPIWLNSMPELHKDLPRLQFSVPGGLVSKNICNFTGKVKGPYCSLSTSCLYTAGNAVSEVCDGKHFEQPKRSEATIFGNNNSEPASSQGRARQVF